MALEFEMIEGIDVTIEIKGRTDSGFEWSYSATVGGRYVTGANEDGVRVKDADWARRCARESFRSRLTAIR